MKKTGNQSGRSMIEMLGVLAIVGALSVGGIMAYRQAMNKNKSNVLIDGLTHTIANFKTLFLNQNHYEELSTEEAFELGVISDSFKRNADKIMHDYGGEIKIKVQTTEDGQTYYAVSVRDIPRDVAMSIATQDWGQSGDLVSINLNDGNQENEEQETGNVENNNNEPAENPAEP